MQAIDLLVPKGGKKTRIMGFQHGVLSPARSEEENAGRCSREKPMFFLLGMHAAEEAGFSSALVSGVPGRVLTADGRTGPSSRRGVCWG